MLWKTRIVHVVILVMGLTAFSVSPQIRVKMQEQPPAISVVTQTNDKALIRRAGWSGFTRLSLGTTVQAGDLIDPKGQPVRTLCANLTEQAITKIGPVPCKKDR